MNTYIYLVWPLFVCCHQERLTPAMQIQYGLQRVVISSGASQRGDSIDLVGVVDVEGTKNVDVRLFMGAIGLIVQSQQVFCATLRAMAKKSYTQVTAETRSFPIFRVTVWALHASTLEMWNYISFLWIVIFFFCIVI